MQKKSVKEIHILLADDHNVMRAGLKLLLESHPGFKVISEASDGHQAVEKAVSSALVVVVSAGNFGGDPDTHEVGYAGITSPANAPDAITVGAVNTQNTTSRADDVIPDYSSRGPTMPDARAKPDLVAPGQRLVSDAAIPSFGSSNWR